jgi:hypothetical protein
LNVDSLYAYLFSRNIEVTEVAVYDNSTSSDGVVEYFTIAITTVSATNNNQIVTNFVLTEALAFVTGEPLQSFDVAQTSKRNTVVSVYAVSWDSSVTGAAGTFVAPLVTIAALAASVLLM